MAGVGASLPRLHKDTMAYTTTAAVKRLLGISATTNDTLIAELIADAEEYINAETGRFFGDVDATPAASVRYFTVGKDTDGLTLYLDDDLASITTVKTNADASTPTTVASTGYVTEPRNSAPYHAIKLKGNTNVDYTWTYTNNPEGGIEITGVWAFSTEPPDNIQRAAKGLTAHWYRQREKNEERTIPADVASTLMQYRRRMI